MDFESQDFILVFLGLCGTFILVFLGFCGISRNKHFTGAADFPRFPEIPFSRISGIPGFPAFSTFPGIHFLAQERNSRFSRNFRVSGNPQFSLKYRFSAPPRNFRKFQEFPVFPFLAQERNSRYSRNFRNPRNFQKSPVF